MVIEDDIKNEAHSKLTNEDFRKLLDEKKRDKERHDKRKIYELPVSVKVPKGENERKLKIDEKDNKNADRKKKKLHYAQLAKEEEEKAKILAEKYRDRAKERRLGENRDYKNVDLISSSSGYRAVAPDAKTFEGAAERRKQLIHESKFLGGDMEHTHLVKGLDYALLQKVRSELTSREYDTEVFDESDEEISLNKPVETIKQPVLTSKKSFNVKKIESKESKNNKKQEKVILSTDLYKYMGKVAYDIQDPLAKSICRSIFSLPSDLPKVNELFAAPRRMTYMFELAEGDEDLSDSDNDYPGDRHLKINEIPTTIIRSKAECPLNETQMTLTTNDIVINKLTQILLYLRQGVRNASNIKKPKKKDEAFSVATQKTVSSNIDDSIYGDIGDYVPDIKVKSTQSMLDKKEDGNTYQLYKSTFLDKKVTDQDSETNKNYFQNEGDMADEDEQEIANNTVKMIHDLSSKYKGNIDPNSTGLDEKDKRYLALINKETKANKNDLLSLASASSNTYAECYPGYHDSAEAFYDSDDEVDLTKMDPGNKKGPLGRKDFNNMDDYSNYMSKREALPKAAFQYGIKMNAGRKTRRTGPKDEKNKLDQEWQKISKIIQQRKQNT